MDKTTLYLPTELHIALREASRRMGRPQAEVIREALQTYLQEHAGRPMPRSIGIANDPELSGTDAEDWYRANFRHE
jgi:metal-responsive CopG/Arc/MetJ family transcriptional regulator